MNRSTVMVEIDPVKKNVVRIFRYTKRALSFDPEIVRSYPRSEAVRAIRDQIWERCGGDREHQGYGQCEYGCGRTFRYSGDRFTRMNMHEEIPKGKGGEVSLANGRGICWWCHENHELGHANRKLRWSHGGTMQTLPRSDSRT